MVHNNLKLTTLELTAVTNMVNTYPQTNTGDEFSDVAKLVTQQSYFWFSAIPCFRYTNIRNTIATVQNESV